MNKDRAYKNIIICGLLIAVISLSIAFAAFSSNLNISGQTKILSSAKSWNVAFSEASADKGGYAVTTASNIADEKTTSITFNCELASSLDSCTLTGKIKNFGRINALYNGYTLKFGGETVSNDSGSPTTGSPNVTKDGVTVTYTNNSDWNDGETVLNPSDEGNFTLKIEASDETVFPVGDEDTTYEVTLTFKFSQTDPDSE